MPVDYSRIRSSFGNFSKPLLLAAGLLVLPLTAKLEKSNPTQRPAVKAPPPLKPIALDARAVRLQRFLSTLHCPVEKMANDFVRAADANHLDWRLLPSIAVIESSGGKAYRNNNIFGWDNGDSQFTSIRAGLEWVASRLGNSPIYRNRDVMGKLRLYNPDETYPGRVVSVMRRISPAVDLALSRASCAKPRSTPGRGRLEPTHFQVRDGFFRRPVKTLHFPAMPGCRSCGRNRRTVRRSGDPHNIAQ